MNKKGNSKSEYSKNQIADSLNRLLENKDFHEISITDICNEGMISRSAFYRNFADKEEVIDYLVKRTIEKKIPDPHDKNRMFFYNDTFVDVWWDEKDLIEKIYRNDLFPLLAHRMIATIEEAIRLHQKKEADLFNEYLAADMAFVVTSVLYTWAKRGFREDRRQLKELTDQLYSARMKRELISFQ